MIIDLRTYTILPTKLRKWLALYEEKALPVQLRHLNELVGFFQTDIGHVNQVVHMWKYDTVLQRAEQRAAMAQDPAWQDFLAENDDLGAVREQDSRIIVPLPFSPMK